MTSEDEDKSPSSKQPSSNRGNRGERERGDGQPARVTSPAGRAYEGDHKNHGEPDVRTDTSELDALIEEINLDELPDSEGPDA